MRAQLSLRPLGPIRLVSQFPSLTVCTLGAAHLYLAELIALAQLIAGAEREDRAHADAEFAEGELRVSRQ
jgi:hypothetical protein